MVTPLTAWCDWCCLGRWRPDLECVVVPNKRRVAGQAARHAEVLPDEKALTAIGFLRRALAFFCRYGIRVERVLTDNGSPYVSRAFRRALRLVGVRHSRTRPYRPQTNGKVERWIRTVLSESLYLQVFTSSDHRRRALDRFSAWYNELRPHLGIGGRTPRQRLNEKLAA